MAGRFPFDTSGGRRPSQFNSAQMRAALGLPPVSSSSVDEASLYLQAQRQQQQQDTMRDFQLRQMILQEQIDQQLGQEQRLRSIGDRLADFPELQQQYRSLLLNDQLQQRREELYIREQAAQQAAAQAAQQLRYRDEIRRQQLGFHPEDMAQPSSSGFSTQVSSQASAAPASLNIQQQSSNGLMQQQQVSLQSSNNHQDIFGSQSPQLLPASDLQQMIASAQQQQQQQQQQQKQQAPKRAKAAPKRKYSQGKGDMQQPGAKRVGSEDGLDLKPKAKTRRISPKQTTILVEGDLLGGSSPDALEKVAIAAGIASPSTEFLRKGTVGELLAAADQQASADSAAETLINFKDLEWPESEDENEGESTIMGLAYASKPAESIDLPFFKSSLPSLPAEPLLEEKKDAQKSVENEPDSPAIGDKVVDKEKVEDEQAEPAINGEGKPAEAGPQKVSNVLEYPYAVDAWWPSTAGVQRERSQAGETSDEDVFLETPQSSDEVTAFRANEQKIRNQLATKVEPGVVEKLPHCRIHRARSKHKKNSTGPELVFCSQVTEVYPNDVMVNCSVCGTWRHAACGGHYKQYSSRENSETPFVAVCENCHEEQKFLKEYPLGEQRIERQRLEQLRRGLTTSAVMRHAALSKHGGTYKWPLGSVSATHIGGHTRSVHARHDKAERQWSEMASRLGKGYGYRHKERVRARTKELERLLVSIEDSESYTDRHNMLLFLLRDTARDVPIGMGDQPRNIFDPAEDESNTNLGKHEGVSLASSEQDITDEMHPCSRNGCTRRRRFDSLFCSDGCGVLALELDLLLTLHDASDIHPSLLRHS